MKLCYFLSVISSFILLVNCASRTPEFDELIENIGNLSVGELSQLFRKTIITTSMVYSNSSEEAKREAIETAKYLITSNLISGKAKSDAVKDAILYDCPDIFNLLIDSEADVNRISLDLRRPVLVLATFRVNNPNYVIRLLDAGAEIDALQEGTGFTALHSAVNAGSFELVKILLGRCANVDVYNYYGYTPLDMAIENENIAIIEALLENGASVNNIEQLKYLINIGAFININAFRNILKPENIDAIKFVTQSGSLPNELNGQNGHEYIQQKFPQIFNKHEGTETEELFRNSEIEEFDSDFVVLSCNVQDEGFVFVSK